MGGEFWHLSRRFFGALTRRGPSEVDRVWVESVLSAQQYELWARQYRPDRRHSARAARQVECWLANQPNQDNQLRGAALAASTAENESTNWVLAAALLHDIGKIEADFGTWGRVFATVVIKVVGSGRVAQWAGMGGWRGRVCSYMRHPEIGAELLRGADSDPRTVAWAADHHKPSEHWTPTIPAKIARALHQVDND